MYADLPDVAHRACSHRVITRSPVRVQSNRIKRIENLDALAGMR